MDRTAFFSSLPFLVRLRSKCWPPSVTVENATVKVILGCGDNDLFDREFFLSAELVNGGDTANKRGVAKSVDDKKERSARGEPSASTRPAFFGRSESLPVEQRIQEDPSLTSIQIAVLFENAPATSQEEVTDNSTASGVFVRLHGGHVYAVDVSQLQKLELQPESYASSELNEEEFTFSGRRKVARPVCLVWSFDCAVFRIFSLRFGEEHVSEEKQTLAAVHRRVSEVLARQSPFASPDKLGIDSPCRSSGSSGSTTVAGHQTATSPDSPQKRSAEDEKAEASEKEPPSHSARMKRRREAYDEYLGSLAALEQILNVPLSSVAGEVDGDAGDREGSAKLGPVLTKIAQLQTDSYSTTSEMAAAVEYYDKALEKNQQLMDDALAAFFPARGGGPKHGAFAHQSTEPQQQQQQEQSPTADTVQTLEKLSAERKKYISERHQLFLLPTRG